MKRALKVILICFVCVIGAFGLAIGGMYLFGGFDEKIVYADNISFSQAEVISSKKILLQLNTTTEEVTRKKVKLYTSTGGEDIIEFPEYAIIGETFTVLPKINDNGTNIGGNVTLYAEYDAVDANLSAKAQCEILIDIPVEEVNIKIDNLVMKPNTEQIICNEGDLLSTTLNITPKDSLVPYLSKGTLKIDNIIDKTVYLELVNKDGISFENSTNIVEFYVGTDTLMPTGKTFIPVKYDLTAKGAIFAESIAIKPKLNQEDFYLKAYVYATYADQEKNYTEGVGVTPNLNQMTVKDLGFTIGAYDINGMTIKPTTQTVYLYEDTNIYLNNPDVEGNDINLGVELSTSSPGIEEVGKSYYLDYVYLTVNNNTYRTLTNGKGDLESDTATKNGLSIKYDGISTQKDEWLWKFKVDDFLAYNDYKEKDEVFLATVTYNDGTNTHVRTFNIIPKIHEVDSLSVVYNETDKTVTSLSVKSNETVAVANTNIKINHSLPVGTEPTFTDLAYYISYDKNFEQGKTTVSTVPSENGDYKVTFEFMFTEQSSISMIVTSSTWGTLKNAKFSQGQDSLEIQYENGSSKPFNSPSFKANTPIYAEVIVEIKNKITSDDIFYIDDFIKITNTDAKFYKKTGENSYETYPHLTIDSVRYYINFDYYLHEETNVQYLKIDKQNSEFRVQGIGEFFVTAQLIYFDITAQKTYWLGRSVEVKIEVYEQLSTLFAYNLTNVENSTYGSFDNVISYSEEDNNRYYILITSSEIDSLKNYILYNQVKVSAKQIINKNLEMFKGKGLDGADIDPLTKYQGIETINSDAVVFGTNWVEVIKDGSLIGYRLDYSINPIYSLEVEEGKLANNFEIAISINVNGTEKFADFSKKAIDGTDEIKQSLQFEIVDRTVTSAVIQYTASVSGGNDGSTEEKALELFATMNNNEFGWDGIKFDENLQYYFKYNDSNTDNGIINSMSGSVTPINVSGIPIGELASFSIDMKNYDETAKVGKGGLTLKNFPVLPDADGKNQGILLKVSVYAGSIPYDFNSRYVWDSTSKKFVLTKNENLVANLYLRVYGLEISIEANEKEVYACEDSEFDLINGTDGIFTVEVKAGSNDNRGTDVTDQITDFSKVMNTNVVTASLATDEKVIVSDDLTKLIIKDDFMENGEQTFYFYVGSTITGRIKIKTGEDKDNKDILEDSFTQELESAFEIATNLVFDSPSQNNKFVEITYSSGEEVELDDLIKVQVDVLSHGLDAKYAITQPIVINSDNTLTFKTAPVNYTAVIELNIIKADDLDDFVTLTYTITVNTIYTNDDIVIGKYLEGDDCCSEKHTAELTDYNLNVEYCDCNSFGTVLENSGATTGLSTHSTAQMLDSTITSFNTLSTLFNSFIAELEFTDELDEFKPSNNSDVYSEYVKFFNKAKELFNNSNSSIAKNLNYNVTSSAVVGINRDFSVLFRTVEDYNYDNLKTVISRLFGYTSVETFAEYAQNLATAFATNTANASKDSMAGRVKYDGAVYTDNGLFILPFAFKNDLSNTVLSFVIVDAIGDMTIWISDIASAFAATNFDGLANGANPAKISIIGRCSLFEMPYLLAGKENSVSIANGKIYYQNKLLENISTTSDVSISFANTDDDYIEANEHMNKTEYVNTMAIWSDDLNYAKDITITLTFSFADGGKFICTKVVRILPNLTLNLLKTNYKSGDSINLTGDSNTYVFTKNSSPITLDLSNFVYNSTEDKVYNKNSFTYDSDFFTDISDMQRYEYLNLEVKNPKFTTQKTKITFAYIVPGEDFKLYFDIEITIKPTIYTDDLTLGLWHEATGNNGDNTSYYYLNAGQENAISIGNGISYFDNLLVAKNNGNITSVEANFVNVDTTDTLLANKHMYIVGTGADISIYSTDLNYSKDVKVELTFIFDDQTEFVIETTIKVIGNLSLKFTDNEILKTETIDLLNENSYILTRNNVDGLLEIPSFDFAGEGSVYSKDNFVYDTALFARYDENNNKALVLKVLDDGSITEGTKVDTTITLIYVATNTDGENYNLTFELDVSVEF